MRRSARRKKSGKAYSTHNRIKLIRGGRAYFDQLLQLIHESKSSLQIQVYIYDNDETGKEVTTALIAAAKRNVQVYLMADGYASQGLTNGFVREMEAAGVHFRFFEPLFKSRNSYFGRRLHHKVVVADNRYALVGGINISNHYNDRPGQPAWLDFALFAEGEIVVDLCRICQRIWRGYLTAGRLSICKDSPLILKCDPVEECELRVRRNDWVMKRNQVSRSYIEMFRKAKDNITIMSGYFLPGPVIRKNLKKAATRGVKIRLILAGMSDVKIAKNAEKYMYDWLLKNDIEIYEYKPCILHGKVAVYDKTWATIGSYNVNIISAYASLELNIDINNLKFASHLHDTLEKIIQEDCRQIKSEDFQLYHGLLNRIRDRISYWFIRLLFYIFTINFRQRDN
jgi:cardiolipin synthase A/B